MTSGLRRGPSLVLSLFIALGLLSGPGGTSHAAEPSAGGATATPLGRLVPVGQHRLHLYCTGSGSPTVVLEAGMGGNHLDWIRAQPQISRTTQVCSYDRAGHGWSEPGPKPRTAERIAGELEELLRNAGIGGPVVLVGHSFGGVLALYYAGRHADQVAGLVLVDSMHPDQFDRFREAGIEVPEEPTRGVIHSLPEIVTSGIPPAYKALAYELATRDSARSFMFNEMRNLQLSLAQVRALPPPGELRAEVILHGRREWDRIYRDGRMENLWIRMQAELAERIGAKRLVVASNSGHQVPLDAPDLVEKIVAAVVRDIRAGTY